MLVSISPAILSGHISPNSEMVPGHLCKGRAEHIWRSTSVGKNLLGRWLRGQLRPAALLHAGETKNNQG